MEEDKLPFYSQLPNCCGLSTFLMMINPEKNTIFRLFLEDLYNEVEFLSKQSIKEYKYTIAINYLLLKSIGNNLIKEFIRKKDVELVEYYMPIIDFDISDEQFSNDNLVRGRLFNEYLYTMKRNEDLKILIYLFGGKYYIQEQEIADPTRSLYFSKRDFKNKTLYERKRKIIEDHFASASEDHQPCMALNSYYHWVAVSAIKGDELIIHNPMSRHFQTRKLKKLSESTRLYLFSYNKNEAFIHSRRLWNFLIDEIQMERQIT
jgi:hypothetical protein